MTASGKNARKKESEPSKTQHPSTMPRWLCMTRVASSLIVQGQTYIDRLCSVRLCHVKAMAKAIPNGMKTSEGKGMSLIAHVHLG